MPNSSPTRRQAVKALALTAGAAFFKAPVLAAPRPPKKAVAFKYSLNMSTIRGHKLGFVKELQVAAKAGFNSVEIWIDSLQSYLNGGGNVKDVRKIITDLGLTLENAIGFARWAVNDDNSRKLALEQIKLEMDLLAGIGCLRIAAPPSGANGSPLIDLKVLAERYRAVLELGSQAGVKPTLEMWGSSQNLKKISDVLYVAAEAAHPDATVLLDAFHIYKGGSSVESLKMVGQTAIEVFHINDYPAGIPPEKISEPDRIYPGDGIAPLKQMLSIIKNPQKPVVLSLEVFNNDYYKQDALLVAQTGLAKIKAVAEQV